MFQGDNSNTYILATGAAAVESLEKQHEIMAARSIEQLQKAGLKEGHVVWDIGCGSGVMTEYLARTVSKTGHVYALDISDEQLNVTRSRIKNAGLNNVTFVQGDITTITEVPRHKADIVYCRLVLMHLNAPKAALKQMCSLMKPDGTLSLQESTMSTAHLSIPNEILLDYTQTGISLGKYNGVDYDIGRKLPGLCSEIGLFSDVAHYTSQDCIDARSAKQAMLTRLQEWQSKAIQARLATPEQIEGWKTEIKTLPDKIPPCSFFCAEQTHILTKKSHTIKEEITDSRFCAPNQP